MRQAQTPQSFTRVFLTHGCSYTQIIEIALSAGVCIEKLNGKSLMDYAQGSPIASMTVQCMEVAEWKAQSRFNKVVSGIARANPINLVEPPAVAV